MAEFLKELSSNLAERLIIALLAAVVTTYVLTQNHDGRIVTLEREVVKSQAHADEDIKRWALIEQRLERIDTLVEIHLKKECE
jgi:hypothetical protein